MDGMFPYCFTEQIRLIRLLPLWEADKSGFMETVVARVDDREQAERKLLDRVRDGMRLKRYRPRPAAARGMCEACLHWRDARGLEKDSLPA